MNPISIRLDSATVKELDEEAEAADESRNSYLQRIIENRDKYQGLYGEYERIQAENEKLRDERDELKQERDQLKQEKQVYEASRESIIHVMEENQRERDRLRAEADRARQERDHQQDQAEKAAMQREDIEEIKESLAERAASQAHREQYRRASIFRRLWWRIVGVPAGD